MHSIKFAASRRKAVMSCLLLVAATVFGLFGVRPVDAAPSYTAIQQLGQWDMTTNLGDHAGVNLNGMDNPRSIAFDYAHHRMFVADVDNSRVLVFNLNNSDQLLDAVPDFVLGQADFIHGHNGLSATTMYSPVSVAYDSVGDRLFVGEFNARVLVFDTASITNGEAAVHVLGQPDFVTNTCCSTTASSVGDPFSLAYDTTRNYLYVTDNVSTRVLVFDVATVTDNEDAIRVLGQTDFVSSTTGCPPGGLTAARFCQPRQLTYDNTHQRLFVSDATAERVTIFDLTTITNGEAAVRVLGQANLTSFVDTGHNAHEMEEPQGLSYDSATERLFVADNNLSQRVLVFNANPATMTDNEDAMNVLGQTAFTGGVICSSAGVGTNNHNLCGVYGAIHNITNNQLYVADSGNNRIMVFDLASITNGEDAVGLIGQPAYGPNSPENAIPRPNDEGFFEAPAVTIDPISHRMYVADHNSRMVIYNLDSSNIPLDDVADGVLGQPDLFTLSGCVAPATDWCTPNDVEVDGINHLLYVSDQSYNRVLIYNLDSNNLPVDSTPDYVLGQNNFTSTSCNKGLSNPTASTLCFPMGMSLSTTNHVLYVADEFGERVVGYQLTAGNLPIDGNADYVVGATDFVGNSDCTNYADCVAEPVGVTLDSAHHLLYVSDTEDNRVLVYQLNSSDAPIDGTADYVLGQNNFDDADCNQGNSNPSAETLCLPGGVTLDPDNSRIYVSDNDNDRVLIFNVDSSGLPVDKTADGLFGQPDFVTVNPCGSFVYTTADSLCLEDGTAETYYDSTSGRLWVPDSGSSRVLAYQVTNTTPTPPAPTPTPTPSPTPSSTSNPTASTPRQTQTTPTTTGASDDLKLKVNLTDGQSLSGTYDVVVSPLSDASGPQNYDYVDLYLDDVLVSTFYPDASGTARWTWDTVKYPGQQVRIVVHKNGSAAVTWRFRVSIANKKPDVLVPAIVAQGQNTGVPPVIAQALPYVILVSLLILILMLLYQSYRERAAAKQHIAFYKRARQLAEEKDGFIMLVSHYMRTPLTLIKGGVDLLGMEVPPVTVALRSSLGTTITAFGSAVEALLTRVEQNPTLKTIAPSDALSSPRSPNKSPLFWVPLLVAGLLIFISDQTFSVIGVYNTSSVDVVMQVLTFVILATGLFIVVRGLQLAKQERRVAQQQVAQQIALDESRNQFIRDSAATLSGQLQVIQNAASQLPAGYSKKTLTEGCVRLAEVLDRFRTVALITPTPATVPVNSFESAELFANMQSRFARLAQQKSVTIAQGSNAHLASQRPAWVAGIVSTLLDNAIAHSLTGSRVTLGASMHHSIATVTVQNYGEGIPKEKLQELFQPFSTVAGLTNFDHPGIGLSLYIDRLLATSLGGSIGITSNKGSGTTVSFSFPTA